jgi:hypothetical protein
MPVQGRPTAFTDAVVLVPQWHWPFVALLVVTMVVGLWRRVARRVGGLAPLAHPQPVTR